MSKSIFISCVYEDRHCIDNIQNWVNQGILGNVVITKETEDKRPLGKDAVKQHIKAKIQGAALVFVLVGDNTHNHDWIAIEVDLANSFNKEVICIRIPSTTGAIPLILKDKRLIQFDPYQIAQTIV